MFDRAGNDRVMHWGRSIGILLIFLVIFPLFEVSASEVSNNPGGSACSRAYAAIGNYEEAQFFAGFMSPPAIEGQLARRELKPKPSARLLRECANLSPNLFPSPVDADGALQIEGSDEPEDEILQSPNPCINDAAYELIVDRRGRVEDARVVAANFAEAGDNEAAREAEEHRNRSTMMRMRFKPYRIRGIAMRSVHRRSFGNRCVH